MVRYILVDPSGGYGKLFATDQAREYLSALSDLALPIGLVLAGGLGDQTIELIRPLVKDFPDLSIDAEGRLRDHQDNLSLPVVQDYLTKALGIFQPK